MNRCKLRALLDRVRRVGFAESKHRPTSASIQVPASLGRHSLAIIAFAGLFIGGQTNVARAIGTEFTQRADDLVVTVDTRWAGNAYGGYYPVRIRVVNRGQSRNLTFRISPPASSPGMPTVTRTIGAQQNATVQFTLPVPMVGPSTYAFLRVEHNGRELEALRHNFSFPSINHGGMPRPALLVISPFNIDCDQFENGVTIVRAGVIGRHPGSGGGSTSDHQIIPPMMLPESWIEYSGVELVAISLDTLNRLPRGNRSAILKWVHCGGSLIVFDVKVPARQSRDLTRLLELDKHSLTAPIWQPADPKQHRGFVMQPNDGPDPSNLAGLAVEAMAVELLAPQGKPEPGHPGRQQNRSFSWGGKSEAFSRQKLMLGYVYAFPENPFPGNQNDWAWFMGFVGPARDQWPARHGISARQDSQEFLNFLIPGIQGVPVQSFLVLITLFTIVIGPLNYWFLVKRRRLYMLIVTIPVIAFVTSVSLFGYSVVAHGFGIKSRARSLTVLDQKSNTAVTMGRIALYAGLAPGDGLRFSPDTAVYPIWPTGQGFESGSVDWTETQSLTSGWLRSRTRTQFLIQSHRVERGRIEVKPPSSEGLPISNGLEWSLKTVLVADQDGKLYYGRGLPVGASTTLAAANSSDVSTFVRDLQKHPMVAPNVENMDSLDMFGINRRRMMMYGRYGGIPSARFNSNLMESQLQTLTRMAYSKKANSKDKQSNQLAPNTYVAILNENPGLELGVEDTTPRSHLHVLVGHF